MIFGIQTVTDMKKRVAPLALAFTVMSQVAFGHAGHGHESPLSPGHYVANPEHLIPLALTAVAAIAFVAVRYYFKKEESKSK